MLSILCTYFFPRYVLPNHFLFQLAEQPPADMAALLRIFHSVPPILRRRSKELLDVIRECVKLQLSNTSTTLIVPEVPEDDVPMIVDGTEESPKVPKDATSKLWSNGMQHIIFQAGGMVLIFRVFSVCLQLQAQIL